MIDAFALVVSHAMLLFVVWRLMTLRDPGVQPDVRFRPTPKK
jgi:hypothetical protein